MSKRVIIGILLATIGISTIVLLFGFRYGSYLDVVGGTSLGLEDYDEASAEGGLIADYRVSNTNGIKTGRCYLHRGIIRSGMSCRYSDGYFLSIENLEKSEVSLIMAGSDTLRRRSDKTGGFSLSTIERIPESISAFDANNREVVLYALDSVYTQHVNVRQERKYWKQWVHIWNH